MLVAFERLEALRYLEYLRPEGQVLVSDHEIVPVTVTTGSAIYPTQQEILDTLHQVTSDVTLVRGVPIAEDLGNARAHNIVVLGALSCWLEIEVTIWEEVIAERVPPRHRELNLKAFRRGRETE
jgi:indolepyruvate ferredoxin oxidoreductase beta subunit